MSTLEPVRQDIPTSLGPAQVRIFPVAGAAEGTLLLGHGAGGARDAADILALTRLAEDGWNVVLVDQPWRVAGRKVATRPPTLDQAWLELTDQLARRHISVEGTALPRPWVYGGRSAGARVACRTSVAASAPAAGVAAVLCLSFPLHPPGRPERSRAEELAMPVRAGLPTLVINGTRDPMGTPTQISAAISTSDTAHHEPVVHAVPGTHSPSRDLDAVLTHSRTFLRALRASVAPGAASHRSRPEESE